MSLFCLIPDKKSYKNFPVYIDPELINQITNLKLGQQHKLAQKAYKFLSINIDSTKLEKSLMEVINIDKQKDIEDQYILLYATNIMMKELFGMHTTEFCARRKMLGLARENQHRPKHCNEETDAIIWNEWKNNEHLKVVSRYLVIAEKTEQPLNIIYSAIKRHS